MTYPQFPSDHVICDAHQEILDEYIYEFLLDEGRAINGDVHIFDKVYKPHLKRQGVNLVNMVVGGDHVAQVMYSDSELRFWDAHKKLDVLNSELEAGCDSFLLCRSAADIDAALGQQKIAVIASVAGGRVFHGKPNLNLLSSLRSLYRCGLRGLQLTGNGRNRLADGVAQERTKGKLTDFGVQVVKEADRLGMIIDTAQLSDYGFYDLLEITDGPIIDSHSCASTICPHPRNISDRRIKAIAESGGVICVSFWAALVNHEKSAPEADDLLRHIDHIVEVAGVEHIGLGPDYCAYKTPIDRKRIRGYANLGPDACAFDRKTPVMSEKYPGWIEGIWYGHRDSDFVAGLDQTDDFSEIARLLAQHGYNETERRLILGENFLRVCRQRLNM